MITTMMNNNSNIEPTLNANINTSNNNLSSCATKSNISLIHITQKEICKKIIEY